MAYADFFRSVTGGEAPYAYQRRLAEGPLPDVLDVPTGLGKTAGVALAWMYRRMTDDAATPRRLVWCLPMRVLVEQTARSMERWIERAAPSFEAEGAVVPSLHVLMGGRVDSEWIENPEKPSIVVGTQDMLLSRALMRGYGMSRFRWPMDFALLHTDALWVFDEVQLMGTALATSAQLEAFRRAPELTPRLPSRSLWVSATLRPEWLGTVDFLEHIEGLAVERLALAESDDPAVRRRLRAPKEVVRADARLDAGSASAMKEYTAALAETILSAHREDGPTLVIVNRVGRAQQLMRTLRRRIRDRPSATELLLLHARFRRAEREALDDRLRAVSSSDNVIIVATQAVEAGVDVTSRTMFTELAPWPSLVQRFGRCNRGGEYTQATVHWMDLSEDPAVALPYDGEALRGSRRILESLGSAASADLPPVEHGPETAHVLRKKDLFQLFDTDPDLSGFDLDVSPYVRDQGAPQVHVFWRDFGAEPGEEPEPERDELCAASMSQIRAHLGKRRDAAFEWDALMRRWSRVGEKSVRPGQVLLLRASDGGYDLELGFMPGDGRPVIPIAPSRDATPEALDGDRRSLASGWVLLARHLEDVRREVEALSTSMNVDPGALTDAASWHDVGKTHPAFVRALLDFDTGGQRAGRFWAKSAGSGRLRYRLEGEDGDRIVDRPHFRHELASALVWLQTAPDGPARDLVAYLIAAHHGRVRMGLRALPGENPAPEGGRYARGIWEGDLLPAAPLGAVDLPECVLRLDVMEMGLGPMGPSWTERTQRLLAKHGPFRLAWLETLLRLADWRASAAERNEQPPLAAPSHG